MQAGRLHHKDSGSILWCSRLGCIPMNHIRASPPSSARGDAEADREIARPREARDGLHVARHLHHPVPRAGELLTQLWI